ncbi:hypothetical protein GBAR_LOCUS20478 [Geodia barretti]|uniref:Calx-beta domain-containing protein n=1 Tax=Geodia barretti TaxID=519541 RepID=A0AA35WWL4_GEOBA|nr:hypothetical protein GBAR_LOCUS20478 [Geodia barretti]
MSLTSPVVNEAHKATPRQDFHVETVDIEIPPGAVGMTNISLNGIIIDDNTVENHIQRFSLMVEVSEDRVFFDSDNSTKKSAQVAIESDDTVSVSLLLSNLVFYESDESPFNICVIVTSEGTDQNCPVEFQVNYTLSFTKYSYTENGDDETIFRDVTVDKCDNMTCVNLKAVFNVQNDEEFNLQLFNVSLLPNAETDIPQSRMIRVFTDVVKFEIRDDDLLQIRLENREHYVFESTSAVNICLVIGGDEDCPINAIYYYRVHTYGGNASAFEDYRPFNSLNVFQVCKERNCFQIDILDSSPLHEDVEYFEFILTIENDVVPFAELVDAQGRVFIIPKPTVNLMAESFTGSEADEKVKVCASLSNYDTRYNISVLINVVPTLWENPQSADYDDFSNETLEMRFNSNEACVDIKLIDDNMVELQYGYFRESFRVTLESPDNNVRLGEVISARVYIIDDDYTRVELDRDLTNFTVREGSSDPARVCASVVDPLDPVCPIQFPAGIVFLSESYSAVPPGDFRAISALRAIKQCDHTVCVDMVYHDDNIVETDEVFQVYITNSPGLDPNIRFDRTRYDITIMDNDVVTIGPDHVNIDVNESVGVVEVCIVAEDGLDEDCPVGFPLNLTLLISEDYTESLVFGECDELYQCLVLSIIDDDRVEEEEQLSIILKNTYERDNVLLRNGTLTVIDDDEAVVGLERLVYSVYEDDEEVEICVTVYSPTTDCPIAFPFEVVFEANPDTAFPGSDYRLVDGFYMFGKCQTRICFLPVDIINNDLMEDTEMFSVTLQLGFSDNINITPNVATVTIMDKDVLIVSFDKAVYDVQETSRNLTVCVEVTSPNVSCPVKTSFSLSFFILGYTAINPEDFVAEFYTAIEFTPCSKRWCAPPITIVNDQQLEQEELFDLILLSDNPELVTPHPSHAIVNIHDDGEMAEVQLQTTAYTVTEVVNDSVSICAVVSRPANGDCPITFECTLNLSVGGDNYPMVLWPCQRQQCVHVPIKNDYQVEMTETLLIRLERSESLDSRILINSSGSLTIYDDPSDNSTVGLESVRYIGLEGEAVEICATVKNPANMDCPIKFEFSLIVSTADDTAVFADDYEEFRSNLTFSTCEMRRCISISTVPDGCIVEELEEFIILLNMVVGEGPLDRIHLEPAEGRVAIVDNDVAYVRFINNTDVVVNEGGGSVLLFLAMTDEDGLMTCSCEFEFSVTVLTRQGTAERDRDYRQIFPMVVFSGELIKPVMVTIIEDETVEELNEDFTVTVARSVGQPANVIPVNIPHSCSIW